MREQKYKRIFAYFAVIALLFEIFLMSFTRTPVYAYAESNDGIDESTIESDLGTLDPLTYPQNPLGTVQLMSFMEYCYSEVAAVRESYGLYLYVYNPQKIVFFESTKANLVEVATSYDDEGYPVDYSTFYIKYLNRTSDNRFYKFKVYNPSILLSIARDYAAKHDGARRYAVSSIQLWTEGEKTSTDYAVEHTYTYTGYAQGCRTGDTSEQSTLECSVEALTTLDIPLTHTNSNGETVANQTYYRTDKSSMGSNHQWQIDTVYFSVDEESLFAAFETDLGKLRRIKAQWYEYQTQPIYVSSSSTLVNALTPYIGVDIGTMTQSDWWNKIGFGFGSFIQLTQTIDARHCYWNWGYGLVTEQMSDSTWFETYYYYNDVPEVVNQIDWLFEVENSGENYITTEELLKYAAAYSEKFGVSETDEYLALLGLSDALFTDTTAQHTDGNAVERGYNCFEFDSESRFDLRSYDSTLSGWDRFINLLYGVKNGSSWEINDLSPIVEVTEGDITSLYSDSVVSSNLYLNVLDVPEFRSWAESELEAGKKVYLFRFAVTDYTQEELYVQRYKHGGLSPSENSYPISCAQEAVFLGFEMITVTYANSTGMTVIPVVQSPINVFDGVEITLAKKRKDILAIIIAFVILIAVLVVLWKLTVGWIKQIMK